jgi:hypothetical protein
MLPVPPVVIFIYFVLFFLMDGRASVDFKKKLKWSGDVSWQESSTSNMYVSISTVFLGHFTINTPAYFKFVISFSGFFIFELFPVKRIWPS